MRKSYQTETKTNSRALAEHLAKNEQYLLPMVDLVMHSKVALDDALDDVSRAFIEALLLISASQVAGIPHSGKRGGMIRRNGRESGSVRLSDRKLRVSKPRLRHRETGEVAIPAYEKLNANGEAGSRVLDILMNGVSTRNYREVLPAMAESVGMSKSAVSREFVEASEEKLRELLERRFDGVDIPAIWLDGMVFSRRHHVIVAVGVDGTGKKHVLGIVEGASENAAACVSLLESLVARGIDPKRRRLFVIDGSKALRAAVDRVFGTRNPVQRCRIHKIRNVYEKLPKDSRDQVRATMRAAYKLDWKEGVARLKKQAEWLTTMGYRDAAASLLEGLEETFTVNRLGLTPSLRRGLATTNIIESPNSGVKMRTRRVGRWRDPSMVMRWCATALLEHEKHFRKVMGYKDLWMLQAALKEDSDLDRKEAAA
ncbi:MAG: IS256 family transposase [Deltaproteobacteria bacterium]|nr:IS256 family transposase [Deltaproteobacteria bacterium]